MSGDRMILVTGGAGFLGSSLVGRLAAAGERVRATLHRRRVTAPVPGVEYVPADLTRLEDCRRVVQGVGRVFHCAANTSGAAVMRATPLVHVTPNIVMNAQLLDAAYEAGVERFVFLGSGAAYPPTGARPVREEEMFSAEPYPVYHPVAWMKRYTEILCETYANRVQPSMSTIIVRPSNVYGPGDKFDFATSHVTAALLRRVSERHNPIEVWGTGDDIRDLIFIEDFLDGLLLAADVNEHHFAVNIASGTGVSVREILSTALEVSGYEAAEVRFDPSKPSTMPIRRIDVRRARERLGFVCRTSLREGIRLTLDWLRIHQAREAA